MEKVFELLLESNSGGGEVLKLRTVPNTPNIALLKRNRDATTFVEILDLENNAIERIALDEKISGVCDFHAIDAKNFYINDGLDFHIKINSTGEITARKKFDNEVYGLNHKHALKDYIFREDMVLLDLKDFAEYNLYDYFAGTFEKCNFTYLYFSEGRYAIFSSPEDNTLGFEIFDKDGDAPRCHYFILEITTPDHMEVKFIGSSEDAGNDYVFSRNAKEIAYRASQHDGEKTAEIRGLSPENFKNQEVHTIGDSFQIAYFDETRIILRDSGKIEILARESKMRLNLIDTDADSPYVIANNLLFYIRNSRLTSVAII